MPFSVAQIIKVQLIVLYAVGATLSFNANRKQEKQARVLTRENGVRSLSLQVDLGSAQNYDNNNNSNNNNNNDNNVACPMDAYRVVDSFRGNFTCKPCAEVVSNCPHGYERFPECGRMVTGEELAHAHCRPVRRPISDDILPVGRKVGLEIEDEKATIGEIPGSTVTIKNEGLKNEKKNLENGRENKKVAQEMKITLDHLVTPRRRLAVVKDEIGEVTGVDDDVGRKGRDRTQKEYGKKGVPPSSWNVSLISPNYDNPLKVDVMVEYEQEKSSRAVQGGEMNDELATVAIKEKGRVDGKWRGDEDLDGQTEQGRIEALTEPRKDQVKIKEENAKEDTDKSEVGGQNEQGLVGAITKPQKEQTKIKVENAKEDTDKSDFGGQNEQGLVGAVTEPQKDQSKITEDQNNRTDTEKSYFGGQAKQGRIGALTGSKRVQAKIKEEDNRKDTDKSEFDGQVQQGQIGALTDPRKDQAKNKESNQDTNNSDFEEKASEGKVEEVAVVKGDVQTKRTLKMEDNSSQGKHAERPVDRSNESRKLASLKKNGRRKTKRQQKRLVDSANTITQVSRGKEGDTDAGEESMTQPPRGHEDGEKPCDTGSTNVSRQLPRREQKQLIKQKQRAMDVSDEDKQSLSRITTENREGQERENDNEADGGDKVQDEPSMKKPPEIMTGRNDLMVLQVLVFFLSCIVFFQGCVLCKRRAKRAWNSMIRTAIDFLPRCICGESDLESTSSRRCLLPDRYSARDGITPSRCDPIQIDVDESTPAVSKRMSQLLENRDAFDEVCARLDEKYNGYGSYYEVLLYFGKKPWEIRSKFEKHGDGPSAALFEWLASAKPKLTVKKFNDVLLKKNIKRKDVVMRLKAFDLSGK